MKGKITIEAADKVLPDGKYGETALYITGRMRAVTKREARILIKSLAECLELAPKDLFLLAVTAESPERFGPLPNVDSIKFDGNKEELRRQLAELEK